jgi:hypothetical protein
VLVVRAAFHTNVGVKRLGLSGFLQLSSPTLKQLITQQGAWPALQDLLLQLLPAFSDRKLVLPAAGGSASSRQAGAVAALQQQLAEFVSSCVWILQAAGTAGHGAHLVETQQQQQQQQQQPTVQQQQQQSGLGPLCPRAGQLLLRYLDQAVTSSDTAATLLFLLQALADGLTSAVPYSPAAAAGSPGDTRERPIASTSSAQSTDSSSINNPSGNSSSCSELLLAFTRVLSHAEFVHPAYVRSDICRTVLQLVVYCLRHQPVGPAAVLSLLAACSPLVVHATALPSSTAGMQQQQQPHQQWRHAAVAQVHQHRQIFASGGFLQWLQAALAGASNSQYSSTVQCMLVSSTGSTVSIQQQCTALHCLGMLVADLNPQLQQELVQAVHQTVRQAVQQAEQQAAAGWQQQQQQLTAAAWLLAGAMAAAVAEASTADGTDSCGVMQAPHPQQQQQPQLLSSCVAVVLPLLLHHHLAANTPPQVAAYDADWCAALVAAVSAAASASDQQILRSELSGWCPHLVSWLSAASEPAVNLQQQLQLLTTAQTAGFGLLHSSSDPPCIRSRHVSAATAAAAAASDAAGVPQACNSSNGQHRMLSAGQVDTCLLLLCKTAPSSIMSNEGNSIQTSSSYSSSLSKAELTDKMLQLHAAVLDQCVSAAAADGLLTQHNRQLVFDR